MPRLSLLFFIFLSFGSARFLIAQDGNWHHHVNRNLWMDNPFSLYGVGDGKDWQLKTWFDYRANSNALTYRFINRLILGGFIEEELKEEVRDNLVDENRGGIEFTTGLMATRRLENLIGGKGYLVASIGYALYQNATFSDDLFELIFFGNAGFAGETATFSATQANTHAFNKAEISLIREFTSGTDSRFLFGLSAGFLQGLDNTTGEIASGQLFTEESGDYIDVDLALDFYLSNVDPYEVFDFDGLGFTTSFMAGFDHVTRGWNIRLYARDIGRIYWNKFAVRYQADTSYFFEGLDVNDFFDQTDLSISGELDSLFAYLGIEEQAVNYQSALPTLLGGHVSKSFPGIRTWLTLGGAYRLYSNQDPLLYARINSYFPTFSADMAATLMYGGYGNVDLGLEYTQWLGERFALMIGSQAIVSFLIPKSKTGSSLYASLLLTL